MTIYAKACLWGVAGLTILAGGVGIGWWGRPYLEKTATPLFSPLGEQSLQAKPLQQYSIPELINRPYQASQIKILRQLSATPEVTTFLFSYQTMGKTMTGQLNLPTNLLTPSDTPLTIKTIVMVRGFVPVEQYQTGVGTRRAAEVYAAHGYATLAPDFFGYGESDPEPDDKWQARFEKPVAVIELLKTLREESIEIPLDVLTASPSARAVPIAHTTPKTLTVSAANIGLWGHSNGGQITLTTLEVLGEPIPATLWAPVTAPFPYSILFFSNTDPDEGKGMRKWLAQLEADYDVSDFTLTQHLNRLRGPLQLHHGTADDQALVVWSDELESKIKAQNLARHTQEELLTSSPSAATLANPNLPYLDPIEFTYYRYPGADHNLQPNWNTVVERDLEFFDKEL